MLSKCLLENFMMGFVEKLFALLQSCNERFELGKMMMLKVVARTVGLHRLILLNLFPYLHKYVQVISVGLNVVRKLCLRIPLLMVTEDLLRDHVLYKKSKEKVVSSAARGEDVSGDGNRDVNSSWRIFLYLSYEYLFICVVKNY